MVTDRIIRLSHYLKNLTGWRAYGAAFFCGALMTLTLAPFFAFPLIIPSFTGLYWLLDAATSRRRCFAIGWWWGWGFHMTGLYWFCVALLTDAEAFAWLIPFALFGLTGVIAIYAGIACWLNSWVRGHGIIKLLSFTAIWILVEYARAHLFSGFPWNLPGYSFGFSLPSLQMAAWIGVYGLTGFTVLMGTSLAALGYQRGRLYLLVVWGLFALGMACGQYRVIQADKIPEDKRYVEGVTLRLVQAGILQSHKWDPKLQMQGLRKQVELTRSPGLDKITHVIWPETAVPYAIESNGTLARLLGDALPRDTTLITGALRTEGDKEHFQIWNTMAMLDHAGSIVGLYDKIHLVPFGEFQPLRAFVPKEWMTPVGDTDFSRGDSARIQKWPGLPPMIPLICYEAIFPEMSFSTDPKNPAQFLLNITNDAWFGMSIGPYQHFNMARMRAVEQGMPLVRVANTGITAMVDGYGRILDYMPLGAQGILDVKLPKPAAGINFYVLFAALPNF